jgi:hypothetical protein
VHPDLLWALENERRADLLRHHQFRQPQTDLQPHATGVSKRVRHSIGMAFVAVGTRLLREGRSGIDLIDTRP